MQKYFYSYSVPCPRTGIHTANSLDSHQKHLKFLSPISLASKRIPTASSGPSVDSSPVPPSKVSSEGARSKGSKSQSNDVAGDVGFLGRHLSVSRLSGG